MGNSRDGSPRPERGKEIDAWRKALIGATPVIVSAIALSTLHSGLVYFDSFGLGGGRYYAYLSPVALIAGHQWLSNKLGTDTKGKQAARGKDSSSSSGAVPTSSEPLNDSNTVVVPRSNSSCQEEAEGATDDVSSSGVSSSASSPVSVVGNTGGSGGDDTANLEETNQPELWQQKSSSNKMVVSCERKVKGSGERKLSTSSIPSPPHSPPKFDGLPSGSEIDAVNAANAESNNGNNHLNADTATQGSGGAASIAADGDTGIEGAQPNPTKPDAASNSAEPTGTGDTNEAATSKSSTRSDTEATTSTDALPSPTNVSTTATSPRREWGLLPSGPEARPVVARSSSNSSMGESSNNGSSSSPSNGSFHARVESGEIETLLFGTGSKSNTSSSNTPNLPEEQQQQQQEDLSPASGNSTNPTPTTVAPPAVAQSNPSLNFDAGSHLHHQKKRLSRQMSCSSAYDVFSVDIDTPLQQALSLLTKVRTFVAHIEPEAVQAAVIEMVRSILQALFPIVSMSPFWFTLLQFYCDLAQMGCIHTSHYQQQNTHTHTVSQALDV